jgi:hypothetical protein
MISPLPQVISLRWIDRKKNGMVKETHEKHPPFRGLVFNMQLV